MTEDRRPVRPAPEQPLLGSQTMRVARGKQTGPVEPAASHIAPQSWELAALSFLTVGLVAMFGVEAYPTIHWIAPIALGAILAFANLQMVLISVAAIWTPLFAVRLSTFVFLCLGALIPTVMGADVQAYVHRTYHFSDEELAKVLLVWTVATAVLITTAGVTSKFERPRVGAIAGNPDSRKDNTLRIGLAFLIPGLLYTLAYELPTHVGWYQITLPGSFLKVLQAAQAVGFFLMAIWAMKRGGISHLAYLLPLFLTILITLVTFNKFISVFAMLFVSLAVIYHRVTLPRILIVVAALLATFMLLKPMISHARAVHMDAYGSFMGGTFNERLGHSLNYLAGERFQQDSATTPLARLSFTAPAAYVIARYDMGLPSTSISESAWTLVPRAIWPDKPEVSSAGRELYVLITGRDTSRLGMTAFADIYWNLGWYGIFSLVPLWGVLLWKATSFSFSIAARRDWLLMPFALLCFEIGLSIDGAFVASIVAPTGVTIVALIGLKLGLALMPTERRAFAFRSEGVTPAVQTATPGARPWPKGPLDRDG